MNDSRGLCRIGAALLCAAVIVVALASPPSASAAPIRRADASGKKETKIARDQFYAVFAGGKKVGWFRLTITREREGIRHYREMSVRLPPGGQGVPIYEMEIHNETTAGEAQSFRNERRQAGRVVVTQGAVRPGGVLEFGMGRPRSASGGKTTWPAGAVLTEGWCRAVRTARLGKDATFALKVFEPVELKARDCQVRIGPTQAVKLIDGPQELTEVVESFSKGTDALEYRYWVDAKGWPMKMKTRRFGVELEFVAANRVYAESAGSWVDVLRENMLQCPTSLEKASGAKSIIFDLLAEDTLRGIRRDLPMLTSSSQTIRRRRGRIVVTVENVRGEAGQRFPYSGGDTEARLATRPTKLLASRDPSVVSLAQKAAGSSGDAAAGARAIEAFVRKYVGKGEVVSEMPTAVEVARAKKGGCAACAVLTGAMCRAVGIPARMVLGVAYRKRLEGVKHVLVPHVWAEVRLGEKWVGLDASRDGWDPRRIAVMACNGPRDFAIMFDTIKYLKVAKITVQK